MPGSGADLQRARLLVEADVASSVQGYDGARLEQASDDAGTTV